MNYYNEIDKSAANWIRQLIKDGLIPPGDVDERSIVDVKPDELKSYEQCHFFCGIAGWPLALQLAGWPSDRPVWTGSCPCQPFSTAGKGLGQSDERHLWPAFFNLIRECRPQQVFGEQVESAIAHGWLDGIREDLEGEGYACGDATLGAHSVGAPHIRQRLYWVANANVSGQPGPWVVGRSCDSEAREDWEIHRVVDDGRGGRMAISNKLNGDGAGPCSSDEGRQWQSGELRGIEAASDRLVNTSGRGLGIIGNEARPGSGGHADGSGESCGLVDAERDDRRADQPERGPEGRAADRRACGGAKSGGMDDAASSRLDGTQQDPEGDSWDQARVRMPGERCGQGFWSDSRWLLCRDGKRRRVPTEPALFPLADGLPYKLARRRSIRPALLKGAGNAIVPQVAAEFVMAFMEVEQMNQKNTIQ